MMSDIYRLMQVTRWPRLPRRLFVLTFPVSIPLWLLAWPVLGILHLVFSLLAFLLVCLVDVWRDDMRRPDACEDWE